MESKKQRSQEIKRKLNKANAGMETDKGEKERLKEGAEKKIFRRN